MSGYSNFAKFYDVLTEDVNYPKRTEYLLGLFEKYDRRPSLLLDLACGTGGFSVEFAKRGIEVIAVDNSPEMLSEAKRKTEDVVPGVLYLCQPADSIDLYGTVNGAVCCLDSINHILEYSELCAVLKRVSLFLEKGRLFIFDINTEYKHNSILGDNTFVIETDDVYCVWQNNITDNNIIDIYLDFFENTGDYSYQRYSETITERAYTKEELLGALKIAGLDLVACFAYGTHEEPDDCSQRNIYITRKA